MMTHIDNHADTHVNIIGTIGTWFVLHDDTHRESRGYTRKYHRDDRRDVSILSEYTQILSEYTHDVI